MSCDVYGLLYEQAVVVVGTVNNFCVFLEKFVRWLLSVFHYPVFHRTGLFLDVYGKAS